MTYGYNTIKTKVMNVNKSLIKGVYFICVIDWIELHTRRERVKLVKGIFHNLATQNVFISMACN